MAEDFGWAGDESFLDADNFRKEMLEAYAMRYEEEQEALREIAKEEEEELLFVDDDDCPLDGDAESALASAGFGTDEDYGLYESDGEW